MVQGNRAFGVWGFSDSGPGFRSFSDGEVFRETVHRIWGFSTRVCDVAFGPRLSEQTVLGFLLWGFTGLFLASELNL